MYTYLGQICNMFNKLTIITSYSRLLSNVYTNIIGEAALRVGETGINIIFTSNFTFIFISIKPMAFLLKYIFKQVIFLIFEAGSLISILATYPRSGFTDPQSSWENQGKAPSTTDLTLTTTILNTNSTE